MGLAGSMGKHNFVDGTLTDQTSILRFVEDNWHTGQIGDGSFDSLAGTLPNMFAFGPPDGATPSACRRPAARAGPDWPRHVADGVAPYPPICPVWTEASSGGGA